MSSNKLTEFLQQIYIYINIFIHYKYYYYIFIIIYNIKMYGWRYVARIYARNLKTFVPPWNKSLAHSGTWCVILTSVWFQEQKENYQHQYTLSNLEGNENLFPIELYIFTIYKAHFSIFKTEASLETPLTP